MSCSEFTENTIKRLTNKKEKYVKRCKDLEDANKNLIRNKNDLETEINDLKQKIKEMQVNAKHTDRLHKQAIERARISSYIDPANCLGDCKIATLENTIKRLTNEKEEYVKHCKDLEGENKNLIRNINDPETEINNLKQKIEKMQVDSEHTDRLHKQAIERISSHNEYLLATTYSQQLNGQ
ncbi:20952_t:CDS:2, partial [Gigaspora margarita]